MSKRICLKLYASLGEYLPPGTAGNAAQLEVEDDATPERVIRRCHVPTRRAHLVLVNGIYLPPPERARITFSDGDTMAVWPPVAGG